MAGIWAPAPWSQLGWSVGAIAGLAWMAEAMNQHGRQWMLNLSIVAPILYPDNELDSLLGKEELVTWISRVGASAESQAN